MKKITMTIFVIALCILNIFIISRAMNKDKSGVELAKFKINIIDQKGYLDALGLEGNNYLSVTTGEYSGASNAIEGELCYIPGAVQHSSEDYGMLEGIPYGVDPKKDVDPDKLPWKARCSVQEGAVFAIEGKGERIAVFKVTKATDERLEFIYTVY